MSCPSASPAWPVADSSAWVPYLERKQSVLSSMGMDASVVADRCILRSVDVLMGRHRIRSPRKQLVSKGDGKFRSVYTFNDRRDPIDGLIVGFFARQLYAYDDLFAPNLYSYRLERSTKDAILRLRGIRDLGRKYAYKVDVSNYFNSIDVDRLMERLRDDVDDETYAMISCIVNNPEVIFDGKKVYEDDKGVMAGTPTSSFLANYYLKDMDWHFHETGVIYCRYADDIIVFADTLDEIAAYKEYIKNHVMSMGLGINPSKEEDFVPGDRITFLGMDLVDGKVDLSKRSKVRAKDRVRKAMRMCRRLVEAGKVSSSAGMRMMISEVNGIFFGNDSKRSWSSWYFPLVSSTRGLEELDDYVQQCIRYVGTGKHTRRNVRTIPYDRLSEYGYLPLRSRYYGGGRKA